MHATIYGRGQMVIPAKARKEARIDTGDVVSVQPEGDGRLLLVRL
jgi:AbrB family looped-hinge helix DNA binding protein